MQTSFVVGPSAPDPVRVEPRRPTETVQRLRQQLRRVKASYDAAQDSDHTRKHWLAADDLSAAAANSLDVRQKLRRRSRYEVANNCYGRGVVLSYANDLIGTGPRFRGKLKQKTLNEAIRDKFAGWAKASGLTWKLQLMAVAKKVDGESFGILTTNPRLKDGVKLNLVPVECDQFSTPNFSPWENANTVDGIEFDRWGNPTYYHLLEEHPGDLLAFGSPMGKFTRLPADSVVHWYRTDRPGQVRGVPEITPALPLFALLRRFTIATLRAAEFAAGPAGVLETDMPGFTGDYDPDDDFEELEYTFGMLMRLPPNTKLGHMKSEHPGASYEMFKREILTEIGRCICTPRNIITGDSAGYNFSSGRLDHIPYRCGLRVERRDCELESVDRVFDAWLYEGLRVPGYFPPGVPDEVPHEWYWDGFEFIEPLKDAQADTERLTNGTTTLEEIYANYGQEWEPHYRQRGKEVALGKELGIAGAGPKPESEPAPDEPDPDEADDEPEEDDGEEMEEAGRTAARANGRAINGTAR